MELGARCAALALPALVPSDGADPVVLAKLAVLEPAVGKRARHRQEDALADALRDGADYPLQLGLNLLWTPLFFGAKQKEIALANILALTGTVVAMTVSASRTGLTSRSRCTAWPRHSAPPGSLHHTALGSVTVSEREVDLIVAASYLNGGYVFLNRYVTCSYTVSPS